MVAPSNGMRTRVIEVALSILTALLWTTPILAQGGGAIKGRVVLSGKSPGNMVIRIGVDPMCSKANTGKQVVQERVAADAQGGLANVFVKLQGAFPQTPVPSQPVVIDQRGCLYAPRVVGVRVGQTVLIKNSDPFLHNVHSSSKANSSFNVGQPSAGAVFEFKPRSEETMLKLGCELHRWMTAYMGIVSHPYFAVSGPAGVFEITKVPVGTHTIQAWHELYGLLSTTVTVKPGMTSTVDFTYKSVERKDAK